MATVPSQDNWTAGEFPTASKLNKNIKDAVNFLLNPPECRLARKTTQQTGMGNGATTAIQFDTTLLDNDSMSNIAASTTKITIVTAGTYSVGVAANLVVGAATGWMQTSIRKNGSTLIIGSVIPQYGAGLANAMGYSTPSTCVPGDYFEIVALSSIAAIATNTGEGVILYARWIGS